MKEYSFKINGNTYKVDVQKVEGNMATVSVNGTSYNVEIEHDITGPKPVKPVHTYHLPPIKRPHSQHL